MNYNEVQSRMIVRDMMTVDVITVGPLATMREVKEIMRSKNISGMPVVDDERKIVGIVSIADVFEAMDDESLDSVVSQRMTKNVYTVRPDDYINIALFNFRKFQCGRLPVVNGQNQVIGVITPNDIVRRLACFLKLDEVEEIPEQIKDDVSQEQVLEFALVGGDFNQAGLAASSLKRALQNLGVNPQIIRRAAIAAYEAEMNVVIHAYEGVLQGVITPNKLLITVKDRGPGIKDIAQAMEVGFSTAPDHVREMGFGAGMGLPNIKKSSDGFEIKSIPGEGTELYIEILFDGGK